MSIYNGTAENTTSRTIEVEVLDYLKLIFAATGMVFNIVTLIVCVFIGHNMRPYVWNIISLTVTDLVMSTGILLHGLLDEINPTNLALMNCLKFVVKCFESASILACLCMLLLIAADQCIGTALPLKYQRIVTRKVAKRSILCVWTFTFSAIFATIIGNTVDEGGVNSHNNRNTCFNLHREYTLYINAILITVSCPIFIGLYIVIYKKIRALKRRDSQRGRRTSIKKATVTTLLLVVPFVLIYVPLSIYILAISFFELQVTWPFWEYFMVVLAGHTICDPVCYAIRVKEIQNGYKKVCQKLSININ